MLRNGLRSVLRSFAYQAPKRQYFHGQIGDHPYFKRWNMKLSPSQRHIMKQTKPQKFLAEFQDSLKIPGHDRQSIDSIFLEFMKNSSIPISSENVAMLIYHLAKTSQMSMLAFQKIELYAYKYKGEYKIRSIFGALYGAIIYNHTQMMDFFIKEYEASTMKFSLMEIVETIEALNKNEQMEPSQKHDLWEKYFKDIFKDGIKHVKTKSMGYVFKIFDAFREFEDYDEEIWNEIIRLMDNKKSWVRLKIIERLYPLTGTFDSAKQLFDKYYMELAQNPIAQRYYNFEELRYRSYEELFKLNDEEPMEYSPKHVTVAPADRSPQEWNQIYLNWKKEGALKEEAQIQKDRSQQFAINLKDRYDNMIKDGFDFSTISQEQFDDLFGEGMPTTAQSQMPGNQQSQQSEQSEQSSESEQGSSQDSEE